VPQPTSQGFQQAAYTMQTRASGAIALDIRTIFSLMRLKILIIEKIDDKELSSDTDIG